MKTFLSDYKTGMDFSIRRRPESRAKIPENAKAVRKQGIHPPMSIYTAVDHW